MLKRVFRSNPEPALKPLLYSEVLIAKERRLNHSGMTSLIQCHSPHRWQLLNGRLVLTVFRNLIPLLTSLFTHRRKKILLIGNRPDLTVLLQYSSFRGFRQKFVFYNEKWMDGFLTNRGHYKLIRITQQSRNRFLLNRGRIIHKHPSSQFASVILLSEVNRKEWSIIRSLWLRRLPVIAFGKISYPPQFETLSTYLVTLNTHDLGPFFFFLSFLHEQYRAVIRRKSKWLRETV